MMNETDRWAYVVECACKAFREETDLRLKSIKQKEMWKAMIGSLDFSERYLRELGYGDCFPAETQTIVPAVSLKPKAEASPKNQTTGAKVENLQCVYCQKIFERQNQLNGHLKKHADLIKKAKNQ